MSRSNIKWIAKEKTAYNRLFIELCTILRALQKVDPLLKQRRLYFAETRLVKQSIDGLHTGVLATIIKKTTDPTSDSLKVIKQLQDHSRDFKDYKGSSLR